MEKKKAAITTVKLVFILCLLYLFVCSLDLLSQSFRLLTGQAAGDIFSDSEFFSNPIVGLMIGILGCVSVQSSSTFTSIIISMVPTVISAQDAVPIIMGSNIGTSVTSTIVSLTQAGDRNQFRRSFAAATVHDMFNWCTVIVMLTLEITTGFLYTVCTKIADNLVDTEGAEEIKILQYITEPFTELIVQTNSTVLDIWYSGGDCGDCTLLLKYCPTESDPEEKCKFLMNLGDLEDWVAGLILVIMALTVMIGSLMIMVKILNSVLQGAIAVSVKKVLNPKWENKIVMYLWGYVNITIGAVMTFLVQSSSVFTSTLTPLVGMGLLEVETVYPLFLGSNVGTTSTGMLAALAADKNSIHDALLVAFVHLFFNLFGILMFYPIPFMRIPIPLCKILGNTTAKYRWFAIAYLIVMFVVLPGIIMGLSLNNIAFMAVGIPFVIILVFAIVVNIMQSRDWSLRLLPPFMRDWEWLPKPLHSLGPYDKIIAGWPCCKKCNEAQAKEDEDEVIILDHGSVKGKVYYEKDVEADDDHEDKKPGFSSSSSSVSSDDEQSSKSSHP